MKYLILVLSCVYVCYGQNSTDIHIPSGPALAKLVNGSFQNLDNDHNGYIESFEFNSFIIVADADNDGCMTREEYKSFSAGSSEVATKIFDHFDPDGSNCITVDKVSAQYDLMDEDHNNKVTFTEFEDYYKKLLQLLLQSGAPIG